MRFNPERDQRRSIRLKGYDYREAGDYFVTICTRKRECLFGEITEGKMRVNDRGKIVEEEWVRTAVLRPYVELDSFVVMPNHIHGITCIRDNGRNTARLAPTSGRFGRPIPCSLPTIIGAFKSACTRRINEMAKTAGVVWQRNYYEHIIRNESELSRIRQYIGNNPGRWGEDIYNPRRGKARLAPTPNRS